MNSETLTFPRLAPRENNKSYKTPYLLALAGIGGGIVSIFTGFVFIIIHALLKGDTIFDEIGTFLMIIAIPLMFVGGHFMDKVTKAK